MAIDLTELRQEIRRMLASKNPRQYPLFKLIQTEFKDYWRARPRAKPFAKGYDPRRNTDVLKNKKPTE